MAIETKEYINPKVDRFLRPSGGGDGEPDKKQWQDTTTGLPCLAVCNPTTNFWCGYVSVPPQHPFYGLDEEKAAVSVHGGFIQASAQR